MQHDWQWLVVYDDGTELQQSEDVGFSMVDINRVKMLLVTDMNDQRNQYAVYLTEGMRPIFFRRVHRIVINDYEHVPVEYINEDGTIRDNYVFATVLGWQKTVKGKNVKSLTWLLHDGSVAVTDRDITELEEKK